MRGPLAMIAGSGDYPLQLARIVTGHGERPYIVALDGAADPEAFGEGADVRRYRLGQLGSLLKDLRRREIADRHTIGTRIDAPIERPWLVDSFDSVKCHLVDEAAPRQFFG